MTKKKLVGSLHAHGCRDCHTRYEDACLIPDTDDQCTACQGGRAWQYLIDNRNPRDCCRETSRLVTKEEKDRFKLAGKHLWFKCKVCARTHPFDPKPKATR